MCNIFKKHHKRIKNSGFIYSKLYFEDFWKRYEKVVILYIINKNNLRAMENAACGKDGREWNIIKKQKRYEIYKNKSRY